MENDRRQEEFELNSELAVILFQNPFLTRPEDEVGQTALVKWVKREYKSRTGCAIKKQDIFGLITKLILNGVFIGRRYGQKMLLKPTQNYYLLKSGKPMIPKKRSKTQISLFADGGHNLFISKIDNTEVVELEMPPSDIADVSIPFQTTMVDSESYNSLLLEKICRYDGPDKELVKYFPAFFNLACNILNDRYTDWHTKVLISSALGYFVLENDVIPDNTEYGYLDDLYILCYVLREIKRHVSSSLLEDNWEYSEDIHELIEEVYLDTYTIIQDCACEILHTVGLRKFKQLELEEYSGTYPHKIAKLAQEKRELIALTAYLIKIIYNSKIEERSFKKVKDFLLRYGDYTEIARLIELSNRDYRSEKESNTSLKSFEAELEKELQQARLKALLEDNETE